MSKKRKSILFVSSLVGYLLMVSPVASQDLISLPFTNLPFPDGTILTTEFQAEGILFSDDDSAVDPALPCSSLPGQDNLVQGGELINLFRIEFVTSLPVVELRAEFRDQNSNNQIHELFELDANLQIIQSVSFDDTKTPDGKFSQRLRNPRGIAGIAACESPIGAEAFLSLTFVTADPVFSDGFESGDTIQWSTTVP